MVRGLCDLGLLVGGLPLLGELGGGEIAVGGVGPGRVAGGCRCSGHVPVKALARTMGDIAARDRIEHDVDEVAETIGQAVVCAETIGSERHAGGSSSTGGLHVIV
jgi:hypothetical protein